MPRLFSCRFIIIYYFHWCASIDDYIDYASLSAAIIIFSIIFSSSDDISLLWYFHDIYSLRHFRLMLIYFMLLIFWYHFRRFIILRAFSRHWLLIMSIISFFADVSRLSATLRPFSSPIFMPLDIKIFHAHYAIHYVIFFDAYSCLRHYWVSRCCLIYTIFIDDISLRAMLLLLLIDCRADYWYFTLFFPFSPFADDTMADAMPFCRRLLRFFRFSPRWRHYFARYYAVDAYFRH